MRIKRTRATRNPEGVAARYEPYKERGSEPTGQTKVRLQPNHRAKAERVDLGSPNNFDGRLGRGDEISQTDWRRCEPQGPRPDKRSAAHPVRGNLSFLKELGISVHI